MASNGWETVGKKKATKGSVKGQKKRPVFDGTDHSEPTAPITIADTNFKLLNDLEDRKATKLNHQNHTKTGNGSNNNHKSVVDQNRDNESIDKKSSPKPKPKKKATTAGVTDSPPPKSAPNKPLTFEQLAKELKVSEFESVSEETKLKFPDMPLIWLKDIAYFLNGKFPSVEPEDVTFADKSIDYPSCALPQNVLEFIKRNIHQCPAPILQLIQEQLLQSLVKPSGPTMGFRIMLQCISAQYPEFTLNNIQKFIQQRVSYANRQPVCLSVLWVAQQSGKKDLKCGLNIWLELMLPIISQKVYTKYIVDSLRMVLELHSNSKVKADVLDVKRFFVIWDFIHSPGNGMQTNFQKQLEIIYPKLKLISIYNNSKQNASLYFPYLFERLNADKFVYQRPELLAELAKCMASDEKCFSVWRTLYSQNLTQSAQLLEYLIDNYRTLPSNLSKKLLTETVLSFRNTNDDFRAEGKPLKDGHEACEAHCETLLNTMSSWKVPIKSILLVLTLLLVSLLAYDTKTHGSFQKSYTGNLLKRTGTLPVVEQAYTKIETYSLIAYSWLAVNLPVYWKSVSAVLSPYLTLFWAKFTEVSLYVWNSTEVLRVWINKTIPPILETISDDLVPKVQSFFWQITSQLHTYFNIFWTFILKNWLIVSNWLQTNVLTGSFAPENIQKVLIQAIDVLQTYMSDAYQWTTTQFKALTN